MIQFGGRLCVRKREAVIGRRLYWPSSATMSIDRVLDIQFGIFFGWLAGRNIPAMIDYEV